MLIALERFGGERPIVSARLLALHEAQLARNCKLWSGKLRPWFRPKNIQSLSFGSHHAIYRYLGEHWLTWPTHVDAVRGPIAGTNRLYWTGEDQPRFGGSEVLLGDSVLTSGATLGAATLVVNDSKGFLVDDPIEIDLPSGAFSTSITGNNIAGNQLTIADALPEAASVGARVVNRSTEFPRASYLLGVPAPAAAPDVALGANSGTIVEVTPSIATANNTDQTTLDLNLTSDGSQMSFAINADIFGQIIGRQTKNITLTVTRDPGGDDEVIFEKRISKTIQGANVGDVDNYPFAADFRWSSRDLDNNRVAAGVNVERQSLLHDYNTLGGIIPGGSRVSVEFGKTFVFNYAAEAGAHTFRLTITDGFVPAIIGGVPTTKSYILQLAARYGNTVKVEIAPAPAHGLEVGDKIQFAGIIGSSVAALQAQPLVIKSIEGDDNEIISVEQPLSVAADYTSGGTWTQYWDDEDLLVRNYVYTYVATLDGKEMEGPPSPASEQIRVGEGQPVIVSNLVDPSDANRPRPYSAIRIYRVAVGALDEDYLFVGETTLGAGSFNDPLKGTALGEVMPSLLWDPPPTDLVGLTEMPNGMLAGYRRGTNEVWLCEPYQPHAWPVTYMRAMHSEVVGLGAFGASLAVGTKGRPVLLTGDEPLTVSEDHLEIIHPNLSERGMVDMGYAILYPSRVGLAMTGLGIAEIVTDDLFSEDEWLELRPESFIASRYDDRYVCFYDAGNGERDGFILDPRSRTFIRTGFWARDCWSDPETGELFMVVPDEDTPGSDRIVSWNGDRDAVPLSYTWRSKEFVSAIATRIGVVKVEAKGYPVKVNLYMDGQLYDTMDVFDCDTVRVVDELGKGFKWEIEVIGNTEIEAIYAATSISELTRYLTRAA